jgi:NADH-quinone oxidoreductase subunit M
MIFGLPLLSVAIWVPIVFGVLVLFSGSDRNAGVARIIALVGAVLGFLVTIPLYLQFNLHQHGMQFVEFTPWIQTFNINYHLGIDGLSLLLILLNSFTTVLVVIAGWKVIQSRVAQYMASFLFLSGLMNGAFSALDAILFYVFFESTLIPMFVIIGVWGGPNRIYSALKFFLYTFFGSVLFLVALIYLYVVSGGSFALYTFYHLPLSLTAQILIFLAFMSAFAVKLPMWPVHTWLPDAHVEAPTGGSVVLAAVMLKLGGYGFLRLSLPIAPDASHYLSPLMITLSLIAIVYIGLVALVQNDMKKLIAYSSVAHMGFVTLGYFVFNAHGMEGAIIQMISHGFISGALFLCIGVMYDRLHTRQISDYGGLINRMPVFATLFMLFAMANCGLPGTSGFVGEFLVVMGAMKHSFWIAVAAASTLIWAAGYSLWLYKRVVFGAVGNARVETMADLNLREFIVLGLLAVAVLALGVYPDPFAAVLHTPVHDLLALVSQSKLPVQ